MMTADDAPARRVSSDDVKAKARSLAFTAYRRAGRLGRRVDPVLAIPEERHR